MASNVGEMDTNDRQYNIPLRTDLVQWQWVCTMYPKDTRLRPMAFTGGSAKEARMWGEAAQDQTKRFKEWDLRQVQVPIAV